MKDHENIMEVAGLQPDFMGFIFYDRSKRYVGKDFILPDNFPDTIRRVGVFVNETQEEIQRAGKRLNLNYIQLHGDESPEFCQTLSSDYKIIKAFQIDDAFDFEITKDFEPFCSFFLFDTPGKNYGGTGITFNWNKLREYRGSIPFLLSGGLSPKNFPEAISFEHPLLAGLDLNSGFEDRPGWKNKNKLAIINSVKQ